MKNKNKYPSKKSKKAIHEFKDSELHVGQSDTIITNRKQAIAIALMED